MNTGVAIASREIFKVISLSFVHIPKIVIKIFTTPPHLNKDNKYITSCTMNSAIPIHMIHHPMIYFLVFCFCVLEQWACCVQHTS